LLVISALFGLGSGAYEFLLPYYLSERHISFASMGIIFALPTVGVLFLRVYLGKLSDLWGRKVFYSAALAASALASWTTALVAGVFPLTLLKSLREAAGLTRDTMHPIVLWEDNRPRFLDFIGKTRAAEYVLMGLGSILAGAVVGRSASGIGLKMAGLILAACTILFLVGFREKWDRPSRTLHLRGRRSPLRMERNLVVIAAAGFIFTAGLSTSHCFVMPLFFSDKFGVEKETVAWVMFLHRVTLALPMLLIGRLGLRRLKVAYILAVTLEGLTLAGSVFPSDFVLAAAVWLLHDLIGAGIWQPVQSAVIQRYSKDGARGFEVGTVMTLSGLGGIIGPLLAGAVFGRNVNAPFFISGLLMVVSAGPLFALRLEGFEEMEPAESAVNR